MENNNPENNTPNESPKKSPPWAIMIIVLVIVIIVGIVIFGQKETTDVGNEIDLTGIHIMADGTVMLPNGKMVEGAEVTPDGMIKLPSGEMVAPVMDLREGGSMEGMNMDEMKTEDSE